MVDPRQDRRELATCQIQARARPDLGQPDRCRALLRGSGHSLADCRAVAAACPPGQRASLHAGCISRCQLAVMAYSIAMYISLRVRGF